MLALARDAHPNIRFDEGVLTALPSGAGSVLGAVYWYSIIHTPPSHLAEVFAEAERILVVGAPVLVAFQAGRGEPVHRADAHGTSITLTNYRHDADQAFLVARRPEGR